MTRSYLFINFIRKDWPVKLHLQGDVAGADAQEFQRILNRYVSMGVKELVVDLREVTQADQTVQQAITSAQRKMKANGHTLKLLVSSCSPLSQLRVANQTDLPLEQRAGARG
jgi:anti-anti-sigma regulatory factor